MTLYRLRTLLRALGGHPRVMPRQAADGIVPRFPDSAASASLRVLVAEDNQTNQAVMRAMLTKLGHRVDVVANGLEAVIAVRERPYDIVLMDVMMPEMDGIAATREIRVLPSSAARVPIVAVTGDAASNRRLECRGAGMQSVLVKPVTLRVLALILGDLQIVHRTV